MTLTKAIEILSEYVFEDKPQDITAFDNATRLGIEAIKWIQKRRKDVIGPAAVLLPSETED